MLRLLGSGVVEPYFFENAVQNIKRILSLFVRECRQYVQQGWDGTRVRARVQSGRIPDLTFSACTVVYERIASKCTPDNFFLWRYLKSCIYANIPQMISELKNQTIGEINTDIYRNVIKNLVKKNKSLPTKFGRIFIRHSFSCLTTLYTDQLPNFFF